MSDEIYKATFASLYDELFDVDLYDSWLSFVESQINITSGSLLELAGGTGRLSILLAKKGFDVTLLDLSDEMLKLAEKHIQEEKLQKNSIQLLQGEMQKFPKEIKTDFKVITSFADSINYLPDSNQVRQVFKEVFNHLVEKGKFLFDVITPYQTDVVYDQFYYNNDDDSTKIFMWTAYPGEYEFSVDHDLKFFLYDEQIDGYKIIREIHSERTYPLNTYIELLKEAGFSKINVFGNFGKSEIADDDTRWFFAVER